MPYCWTLDHIGILARTVADAGLLLQTVAGYDPEDPNSAKEPVENYTRPLLRPQGSARGPAQQLLLRSATGDPRRDKRVIERLEEGGASLRESASAMEEARTVSLTVQMPRRSPITRAIWRKGRAL